MSATRFDAVVLGGGPAGLATALALRRQAPVSVMVADAGAPGRDRIGETVPPDLLVALGRLGLTERFHADGHAPCPGSASIWGRDRVGYNDAVLSPMGPPWRLDRRRFDRMLVEAAVESGVSLRWRTQFEGVAPGGRGGGQAIRLSSTDGGPSVVQAGCVIDATGPGARFARAAGARRQVDDRLVALARMGVADGATPTMQTLLEAVADGWWYGARLVDGRAIVMFVTDRAGLRRLRIGREQGFDEALAATTLVGPLLARPARQAQEPAPLRVLPVVSSALDRTEGNGWVAVGDAAASFDPVAGQGVYKALAGAEAAAHRAVAVIEGAPGEWPSPDDRSADALTDYRRNRAHLYGLEHRFGEAPFWAARRARAAKALEAPLVAVGGG